MLPGGFLLRERRRRQLFWPISRMRGECERPSTSSRGPRAHLCPPSPGPLVPAPGRPPLPRGGEGSESRGPTGSFLPSSLPPRLPPAAFGTAATSESASLCALFSRPQRGAAAPTAQSSRAGARGRRGAAPGPGGAPGQGRPSVCLAVAPRLPPHTYIPFLRRLSFSRTLLPCFQVPFALGLQVPPISGYLLVCAHASQSLLPGATGCP